MLLKEFLAFAAVLETEPGPPASAWQSPIQHPCRSRRARKRGAARRAVRRIRVAAE